MNFLIDPDIRKAIAPPGEFYHDEATYKTILEAAFRKSWQWVGHQDSIPEAPSAFPLILLEGSLNEPVVFTRDKQDHIRAFSNVCTHRGNTICRRPGAARNLVCSYHRRTFDLGGKMIAAPGFPLTDTFPSASDHMFEWKMKILGPHIFISANPNFDFETVLSEIQKRISFLPMHDFRFDPSRSSRYTVKANWVLYCDNYLEGLHIASVHGKSIAPTQDPEGYEIHLMPHSSLQIGISKPGGISLDIPANSPDAGKNVAAYYFWIFPNMMFNFYPWGLSINVVKPQGIGLTYIDYFTYVWKPELLSPALTYNLRDVEMEDGEIVEMVQAGTGSRQYQGGKYAPEAEKAVHHFHRHLAELLPA